MSTKDSTRKFHFLREIASGGFGTVYLAKVTHADGFSRVCAVKLLKPQWAQNKEIAARMRDEARLLGRLRHKNIVNVIDLTRIDGRAAVLMEYLEAVDVKVIVRGAKKSKLHVPLRVALEVCASVSSALDAAYNRPPYEGDKPLRVVHRDIKPSNIMIDGSGLTKVLDFGVARAEFDEREAKTQELSFGSVDYMAPERLFFEPETPLSDVYGLGATLYEFIALQKFGKSKLSQEKQEAFVGERFEDLLERHPMASEEVEDLLHDLLYDMLSFQKSERPTAAQCVTRMRRFARSLKSQPTAEEWAESVIPLLVEEISGNAPSPVGRDTTSMVGRILVEDTAGFGEIQADAEEELTENVIFPSPASELPTLARPLQSLSTEASPPDPDPNDARWAALKQSTLDGLAGAVPEPVSDALDGDDGLSKAPPPVPAGLVSASLGNTPSAQLPSAPIRRVMATPVVLPPTRRPDPVSNVPATETPSPAPAPARPPPVPPPVVVEKPPVKSGNKGMMMGAAALFLMGVSAAVVLLSVGIGAWLWVGDAPTSVVSTQPSVEVPSEVAPAAPAKAEPSMGDVEPEEGARFLSMAAGTRKVSVRCEGGSASGKDSAVVIGDTIGDCTVTALDGDRKRWIAVVKEVEFVEYRCFVDGKKECNPSQG